MTFIFEIFEIQMDQLLNFLILKKETFNYLSKRSKNINERFLNLTVPNINILRLVGVQIRKQPYQKAIYAQKKVRRKRKMILKLPKILSKGFNRFCTGAFVSKLTKILMNNLKSFSSMDTKTN